MATVNIPYEDYQQMKTKLENQSRYIKELEAKNSSIDQEIITNRILEMGMQIADDVLSKALRIHGIKDKEQLDRRDKLFNIAWQGAARPDDFWWMKPPYKIEVKPAAFIADNVKELWFNITKLQEAEEQ